MKLENSMQNILDSACGDGGAACLETKRIDAVRLTGRLTSRLTSRLIGHLTERWTGRFIALAAISAACAISAGCAGRSSSGSVYTPGQAQQEQTVRMGLVESVRQVTIERAPSGAGAVAGGVVGGVAGGSVGSGRGSTIGSVLGAVAGGVAGQAIESGVGRKAGLEITVKLDNGELRAITQEADEAFKPGERVRLLSGGGVTRVTR